MAVLWVTAALFLAWAAGTGQFTRMTLVPPRLATYRYEADFRQHGENMLSHTQQAQGWQPVPGGLAAPPGPALLTQHFEVDPPPGYAVLRLWLRRPPDVDLVVQALAPVPASGATSGATSSSATPGMTLFCARARAGSGVGTGKGDCLRVAPPGPAMWKHQLTASLTGWLWGASYDLTPLLRHHGAFTLQIQATNHGDRPAVILEELRLAISSPFWGVHHLRFLYLIPLPALLTALAAGASRHPGWALLPGIMLAAALWLPGSRLPWHLHPIAEELFWGALAIALAIALAPAGASALLRRTQSFWKHRAPLGRGLALGADAGSITGRQLPERPDTWMLFSSRNSSARQTLTLLYGFVAYGITLGALGARLALLIAGGDVPLEPDAQGYLGGAQSASLARFYVPLGREPLFPLLAHLWIQLAGDTPLALRLFTVAMSTLTVFLVYFVGRVAVGPVPALAASAIMAAHPFFQWNSQRGLREDTSTVLLLGLLALLFARSAPPALWLSVAAGISAGIVASALLLIRFDLLGVVIVLLLYAIIARPRPWPRWAAMLAVCTALVAPYLVAHWRNYGDPLYATNLQARAFRNYEFHDLPGFPTRADMDRDQFLAGPPITVLGYYFGLHTPADLLRTTARGSIQVMKSVAHHSLPGAGRTARFALAALLIAGAIVALFHPYRYLALAGALLLLQYAFLHVKAFRYSQVDPYGGVDPRLFMVAFPFLTLCAAALLTTAPEAVRRWVERSSRAAKVPAG